MTRFARAVARICRPDTPAPSRRLPRRSAFLSLPAGLPALVLIVLLAGCGADPGPEVWVIGLDGADWDLLDPMIEAGELPHLAALRRQGAWGRLRSEPPLISPVLWTTIATGRSPDTHGVAWFMTENADGGMVPVSSAQRRVRSFWNMAADADLTSGVIGWWATYPADPVAGFLISDYVGWHSFGVNGREADDRGKTWPPELMADVRRLLPGPADVPLAQVAAMVHRDPAELVFAADADPYAHPVNHLRQAMATSRGYVDLALTELERGRPDLLAVYFEGTDAVMHLFGDHQPPRQPWIAADEFAAYRDVVAAYWRWQDALLGELLAARGPATTVIVVSDHGFRVGDERRKEDAFHIETADDDHMLDGIVIISGPEVRPGARLEDADIYDVAPTVLHALGLPVGADMPGRVLTAALDPVAVAARPVRSVVTWETTPFAPGRAPGGDATATANLTSMLRSLGYIAGQDDGGEPAASPAEAVNLATVLLRQGRAREAVDRLRPVAAARPDVLEVRLVLAQALARTGDAADLRESEALYRHLLAEDPARLEVREDLATLLLHADRPADAVPVLDAGLVSRPDWVNGLVGRARAEFRLGRTDAALGDVDAALAVDPRHADAHRLQASLLAQADRPEAARAALARANRLEPGHVGTGLELARSLQAAGRDDDALAALERTLAAAGPDASLLAEKGALLLRARRLDAAVAALEASLAGDPGQPLVLGNLGLAHALAGRWPEAVSCFEKVVALAPEMVEAHAQLGALYARTGRTAQARSAWRRALDLDPDCVPALVQLARLERAAGNAGVAAQLDTRARRLGVGVGSGE